MPDTDVLILGGGVAGLSCRARLGDNRQTLLLEAQPTCGGLLQVHGRGDFIFDTTVHLLFFQDPHLEEWVLSLLPLGVHRIEKRNLVWQNGRQIPYPYQYHAHALPESVRQECHEGFVKRPEECNSSPNFEQWLLSQFGAGFYRWFFLPYNQKLYGVPPRALEATPLTWMIPADIQGKVLRGMTADQGHAESPSRRGFYPRGRRGVAALVDALAAAPGGHIRTQAEVVSIDVRRRSVTTAGGRTFRYRQLISSLPLPVFLSALDPLPAELGSMLGGKCWRDMLPCTELTVVEVGARESGPGLPAHWTYFPDAEVPFYRLVRLEAISADLAPPGGACLLLECEGRRAPERSRLLHFLCELGVLSRPHADHFALRRVAHAYAVFTPQACETARRVRVCLDALGIQMVGRYGTWSYSSVEDAIRSGMAAADRLHGAAARPEAASEI